MLVSAPCLYWHSTFDLRISKRGVYFQICLFWIVSTITLKNKPLKCGHFLHHQGLKREFVELTELELLLQRKVYPRVRRPGRYAGGELNSKSPRQGNFQVALAFPDLYEIAFSYYGFQILYHILNQLEGVSCQRVYAPGEDLENILRQDGIPLFTLEGKNPLYEIDVVGFTLQYELHAPDILNMLQLGKIPLRSIDRQESDPLILAGGPLACNPAPFTPYCDAFILGDGEESFPEVIRTIQAAKTTGASRKKILQRIAGIDGVYSPAVEAKHEIKARYIEKLRPEYYPLPPITPLISVEHDRLTVEVMRGCSRGCRFCNAGFFHRPTREAEARDILAYIENGLKSTGYEEFSLFSLSTADYSALGEVLEEVNRKLEDPGVSLSYPSLRPDAFSLEAAEGIGGGRKSSLTFAPEAGSERLRGAINKDLRNEDLFRALKLARLGGWRSVKLYFMLGLPYETDDDLFALIALADECRRIMGCTAKKPLHISLSVFSPKPNTPFEREGIPEIEEIHRRINLVRSRLSHPSIKVSFHDPAMAYVETAIGRGDGRMAEVIETVFRGGGRFQGWSDRFDFKLWSQAITKAGLDWETFTGEIAEDSTLLYKRINFGLSEDFLRRERSRAERFQVTPDCRVRCSQCGMECPPPPKSKTLTRLEARRISPQAFIPQKRIRFRFSRTGAASLISHLETVKQIERSLRRGGFPLAYSQGFHPHPKLSFGYPLPLGYNSVGDYFDAFFTGEVEDAAKSVNKYLCGGLSVNSAVEIPLKAKSLSVITQVFRYLVDFWETPAELDRTVEKLKKQTENTLLILEEQELKRHLLGLELLDGSLKLTVRIIQGKAPRAEQIIEEAGCDISLIKAVSRESFALIAGVIYRLDEKIVWE